MLLNRFPPEILSNVVYRLFNNQLSALILTGDKLLLRKIKQSPVNVSYDERIVYKPQHSFVTSFFKNVKSLCITVANPSIYKLPESIESFFIYNTKRGDVIKWMEMLPEKLIDLSIYSVDEAISSELMRIPKLVPRSVVSFAFGCKFQNETYFVNFCKDLPDLKTFKFVFGFDPGVESALALPRTLVSMSISKTKRPLVLTSEFCSMFPPTLHTMEFVGCIPTSYHDLPSNVVKVIFACPDSGMSVTASMFPKTVKHFESDFIMKDLDIPSMARHFDTFIYEMMPGIDNPPYEWMFLREKESITKRKKITSTE